MKDEPLDTFIKRRMSVEIAVPEKVIDRVMQHCFSSAYDALSGNMTVELSGFGKFIFNKKKALKYIEKLEIQKEYYTNVLKDPELSNKRRNATEGKLRVAKRNSELLKKKMNYETKLERNL